MRPAPARPKPVVLLILDGWGHRDDPADNALAQADLPHWRRLWGGQPHTLIHTEGRHVGLPDGQMGNSEVGHMNLGTGRIVYQDLTRIDAAIEDGSFFANAALVAACEAASSAGGTLNVIGLLSPGGVHSHERHIFAMLDLAQRQGVERVAVHAFLDGRDTPPKSAQASLAKLQAECDKAPNTFIASVSGRYYAMDRDQRWERVQRVYDTIASGDAAFQGDSALAALQMAYARGETDEFMQPTVIAEAWFMGDGDAMVFMNFRADRARELSHAFVDQDFKGFPRARVVELSAFVTLSEYEKNLAASAIAFPSDDLRHSLGELVAEHGMTQLRIAETEKYAHVTFFFSGGRETAYPGEQRILVPSPKVATYDLQPEMSCPELTALLVDAIRAQRFDLIVCNIANPDMVGHTGNLAAAIQAAEAVDVAIGAVDAAVRAVGGALLITADHGNLEMMRDAESGQPHTAHTVGPVPLVYVGTGAAGSRDVQLRDGGALRDVAPTLLELLGLPQPPEMSGRSLFVDG